MSDRHADEVCRSWVVETGHFGMPQPSLTIAVGLRQTYKFTTTHIWTTLTYR
jgi:hypothetical protein